MTENDLSVDPITSGLETRFVGQRTLYFPSLTTTMDVARKEALVGAPEGTVVIASEQTAARGRLQRVWLTPQGNIALSVILYPHKEYLHSLIMVASLAVSRCIEVVTNLTPEIKWPNDILVGGKKVCGILIESDVRADRVNYAIMGIGINVNLNVSDFPEIRSTATSLSQELGEKISRLSLVRQLLKEIESYYLASSTGDTVYEQWRKRLITLGKKVQATSAAGETTFTGIAESVDRDGSLWLRLEDGSLTRVIAGDVTLNE
ncbi:MAG: biotin--[acetyl-CoA-carboxylase] ligase [Dehalococcoidales bacterium]|nr:MAG: biotin--[acetyl-CoA-carboxylase] ligase [Dehalococcoidales bacterium]